MGSLEELHSGRDRSYIVAGWAIIIGTLEEGYFQPPILLHSLPMDTRAIIRLSCGIFLDGFAGKLAADFYQRTRDLLVQDGACLQATKCVAMASTAKMRRELRKAMAGTGSPSTSRPGT